MNIVDFVGQRLAARDEAQQAPMKEAQQIATHLLTQKELTPAQLELLRDIGNKYGNQMIQNYYQSAAPDVYRNYENQRQIENSGMAVRKIIDQQLLEGMGGQQQTSSPQTVTPQSQSSSMPLGPPTKGAALNDTVARMITEEAQRQGLDPRRVLALAHTESGLNPAAVSAKGALGVMQLMPQTANGLGVNASDTADNIRGGVTYYGQLLKQFGDPEIAAAAYNAGPESIKKYGGIPPFAETQEHLRRFREHYDRLGQPQGGNFQQFALGKKSFQGDPSVADIATKVDADMRAAQLSGVDAREVYRSEADQAAARARYEAGTGGRAAPAGKSLHQKGLAIDVNNWKEAAPFFAKYGMVNPFPDDPGHFQFAEQPKQQTAMVPGAQGQQMIQQDMPQVRQQPRGIQLPPGMESINYPLFGGGSVTIKPDRAAQFAETYAGELQRQAASGVPQNVARGNAFLTAIGQTRTVPQNVDQILKVFDPGTATPIEYMRMLSSGMSPVEAKSIMLQRGGVDQQTLREYDNMVFDYTRSRLEAAGVHRRDAIQSAGQLLGGYIPPQYAEEGRPRQVKTTLETAEKLESLGVDPSDPRQATPEVISLAQEALRAESVFGKAASEEVKIQLNRKAGLDKAKQIIARIEALAPQVLTTEQGPGAYLSGAGLKASSAMRNSALADIFEGYKQPLAVALARAAGEVGNLALQEWQSQVPRIPTITDSMKTGMDKLNELKRFVEENEGDITTKIEQYTRKSGLKRITDEQQQQDNLPKPSDPKNEEAFRKRFQRSQ